MLYDLTGRVIRENIAGVDASEKDMKWDISGIPSGAYILRLLSGSEQKATMVTISH